MKKIIFVSIFVLIIIIIGHDFNTSSNEDVVSISEDGKYTLYSEKETYGRGENIRAWFVFDDDIHIDPLYHISRKTGDTWSYIGEWSLDGTQYVCCGAYPPADEYTADRSPVEIIWDQKISEGSGPDALINGYNTSLAESDEYRMTVFFGDKSTTKSLSLDIRII